MRRHVRVMVVVVRMERPDRWLRVSLAKVVLWTVRRNLGIPGTAAGAACNDPDVFHCCSCFVAVVLGLRRCLGRLAAPQGRHDKPQ